MEPRLEDYVRLFQSYGPELEALDAEPDHERYDELFHAVLQLLFYRSAFNDSLPDAFTGPSLRYYQGHPEAIRFLSIPINRHYMLCDIYDYITMRHSQERLRKRIQARRWSGFRRRNRLNLLN